MVFVVAVHSLMVVDTSVRAGVITEVAGQSLFFTANALFFLLSGRFNLRDVPEGKLGDFYLKKFRGVILPALVIFFVRALYDLRADPVSLRHVVGYFVRGSLGQYSGIEYWFIFSLAKLLLAAPFLAPAFAHLSPKRAKAFLGIGLAWFAVLFVCNNAGVDFSWDFLFSGFVFPFCLGPSIEELLSGRRARRALAVVAPLSWIATTYLVLQGWRTGAFDNSPLYMLLSFGIYIGLLSLGRRLAARLPRRAPRFGHLLRGASLIHGVFGSPDGFDAHCIPHPRRLRYGLFSVLSSCDCLGGPSVPWGCRGSRHGSREALPGPSRQDRQSFPRSRGCVT
jgi:hypothetical protein